jgi:hypothetical protein
MTAVAIEEWPVPWPGTRPRDPYVAPDGKVWFVGQTGDDLARFELALPPRARRAASDRRPLGARTPLGDARGAERRRPRRAQPAPQPPRPDFVRLVVGELKPFGFDPRLG